MTRPWTAFLAALPPDPGVAPCAEARIADFTARLPDELLAFWREVGLGSFGGGLLHFVDPDALSGALATWLGGPNPRRIAFARTAFGELYYWRDLRPEAAARGMTGANPGELGDVSCVDAHYGAIDVAALDVPELFTRLADPEYIAQFLRAHLARRALEIYGPLGANEQLAFVPALALGGVESIENVQKVAMDVHSDLLRQTV